jgi:hypothetical protein
LLSLFMLFDNLVCLYRVSQKYKYADCPLLSLLAALFNKNISDHWWTMLTYKYVDCPLLFLLTALFNNNEYKYVGCLLLFPLAALFNNNVGDYCGQC